MLARNLIIHIFDDTPHHYVPMQSFFNRISATGLQQEYWIRTSQTKNTIENLPFQAKTYNDSNELIEKLNAANKSTKFIFHGLFDLNNIATKLILNKIASRCSCVIWGAEIYRHTQKSRSLKQRLAQIIHAFMLWRFDKVFCLNSGDAYLVNKYLLKKEVEVLPYPLISAKFNNQTNESKKFNRLIRILIGNSAASSNEHLYAFEQLSHLSNDNIEVHVPLNYGGEEGYVSEVINKGIVLFGDKFKPITTMLSKDDYDELLLNADIAVFAHQRQQGLYVAYAMLQMGKSIYLRENTTSYKNLTTMGFNINVTEQLSNTSFDALADNISRQSNENIKLFEQNYTEKALLPKWQKQFLALFN